MCFCDGLPSQAVVADLRQQEYSNMPPQVNLCCLTRHGPQAGSFSNRETRSKYYPPLKAEVKETIKKIQCPCVFLLW